MRLIQLVPSLPPVVCGVADYAMLVGGAIEQKCPEIRCAYLACGHKGADGQANSAGRRHVHGPVDGVRLWREIEMLADELGDDGSEGLALIVQYSPYGFDLNGAPHWLIDALARRPARFQNSRLVTFFHELYATGWPWRRAFWCSSRQQAATACMARLSDALMTNREQSARWLENVTGRMTGSVPSLPVPSNVGEPHEIQPWDSRAPHAVTFGGARFKRPFLVGRGAKATSALCRKLQITTLINVGQRFDPTDPAFTRNGIELLQTGYMPASELSGALGSARIALFDYLPGYYCKSGVLAAMAAHGTPPLFPCARGASDGLLFTKHLWDVRSALSLSCDDICARLSTMARVIRQWYSGHTSKHHATALASAIRGRETASP